MKGSAPKDPSVGRCILMLIVRFRSLSNQILVQWELDVSVQRNGNLPGASHRTSHGDWQAYLSLSLLARRPYKSRWIKPKRHVSASKKKMEMDPKNNNKRKHQLTAGELSPPGRRWRRILLKIRKETYSQGFLFCRPQTRGEIFRGSFLVHAEDRIRKVVREELHRFVLHWNLPPRLLADQNLHARYQLRFMSKVRDPTFTTDEVQDEEGNPIQIAIYDSYTGSIISPSSPLSSVRVRIIVLDAEFSKDSTDNWSRREFNLSILREREGKGPILTCGGRAFRLKNGRGSPDNIIFGDNSSWTKSGFRLGVMVEVEGEEEGCFNGERVKEGVSDRFRVKDRRGKASQKPDQLKLEHKVQSLKNIGKDRASLLEENNIRTVEHFLYWYYHKQPELRNILGIKSDSDKGWKAMVNHAMECDNEFLASYNGLNNTVKPQQIDVLKPDSNQIYFPINNNANQISPLEEDLTRVIPRQDQFSNCSEITLSPSVFTNSGPRFVGSGSSEVNPCENDVINQDDMSAWYRELSSICDFSPLNSSNECLSTDAVQNLVEVQSLLFHDTNDMITERGITLNVGSMQHSTGGGLVQLEIPNNLVLMDDLFANAESTPNNICQIPSRSNSFESSSFERLVQDFVASMYVGPLSRRKMKIKALLKWITRPAARKRARIAPPDNQTTVPAM